MEENKYKPAASRYGSSMQYRRCGRSGIELPAISLGLWHNFGAEDSFENARQMVHYAFDHGITSFDLANNYGPPAGSAEETFGRLMAEDLAPYRDELFVSTKAGHDMWPGPYGTWGSRKHLFASLHASLRRMKLDYVDVFYSHRYDPQTPLEETMQALADMVRQGKALYVGISKYPREVAGKAYAYLRESHTPCLLYQGRFSLLSQVPREEGIIEQAAAAGVGFMAFSPLAQGLLTGKYLDGKIEPGSRMSRDGFLKKSVLTPQLLDRLHALGRMARGRGQTLAQFALSWLLHFPEVTSVLVGASSVKQLADNLQALSAPAFTDEELQETDRLVKE